MSNDPESIYEEYLSKLKQALPNVDPNFVHRIMYLERKIDAAKEDLGYSISDPQIHTIIRYKDGVDTAKKRDTLVGKYKMEVENGDEKNTLHVAGRSKLDKIKEIATDADIVKMTGKADPGVGE